MSNRPPQICPYAANSFICPVKKCVLNDAELINFIRHFVLKSEISSIPFVVLRKIGFRKKTDLLYGFWYCLPGKMKRALKVIYFFLDYFRVESEIDRLLSGRLWNEKGQKIEEITPSKKLMRKDICEDIRKFKTQFSNFIQERG